MAFPSQDTQPQLWPTQADGLDTQVGLFYNLDSQDVVPDYQEPTKGLWESQTQGWEQTAVDLAKNVAEVALDDALVDPAAAADPLLPFTDAPASVPAFRDTGVVDSSDDEDAGRELPAWTCAYCGNHNPKTVAQCEVTGKWFCNGAVTPGGTCIVQHLVRGRYKEVRLHPDSPLGGTLLECYHSGSRNIFALGFVPIKSDETMVLLARDTPQSANCVKELDLDLSAWEPIIQDRAIVPWLVEQPSKEECSRARKLKASQMMSLENVWKSDPDATLQKVQEDAAQQKELLKASLRYRDAYEYQGVFEPLVQIEADYDKACREALRKENLKVDWQQLNRRWIAVFYFPRDDEALHVIPGDELVLQHETAGVNGAPWEASGVVIRITLQEQIALELHTRKNQHVPSNETAGFAAELTWNSTAYDRMQSALKTFAEKPDCMSSFLYHQLLGHDPDCGVLQLRRPAVLQAPNMPVPNHSQVAALDAALRTPFTMIQGPPGTGKTVTSTTLVWLLQQATGDKVLMAAPSNVAVDHLAHKISQTGLKVVRLCSQRAQVNISPMVEHLTLHYQVANMLVPGREALQKLLALKKEKGELSLDNERKLHQLKRVAEAEVLKMADVVCVTCIGAGDKRLRNFRFPRVLVDESTQATEPECLLPLTLGAEQVILVGDHCQLGPVVMNKLAERCGLSLSLVERMVLSGIKPIRLAVQYRMHPCLSEFPSNTFYEGELQNGVTEGERLHTNVAFPWPDPTKRLMFYQQRGAEEISSSGTSYVNRVEAAAVEKVVTCFLSYEVRPEQIGVITPYEGQRAQIVRVMEQFGNLSKTLYSAIEVASVDAFQGREKDYIIFSCVRASQVQGIGFLADPRRLNVALTRAKFGCVILGNAAVLGKQPLWNEFLTYVRDRGLMVEGPLQKLRVSHIALPRPECHNSRHTTTTARLASQYRPTEWVIHPTDDDANSVAASSVRAGPMGPMAPPPGVPGAPPPPPIYAPQPLFPHAARMQHQRFAQMAAPVNPFAIPPVMMPQGVFTQEAMTMDRLGMGGMSLRMLGQMSFGAAPMHYDGSAAFGDGGVGGMMGSYAPKLAPGAMGSGPPGAGRHGMDGPGSAAPQYQPGGGRM